jgi:cell division protein FtsL
MVLSVPLALGAAAWQSARFASLQKNVDMLNEKQEELVDSNKRIITDIAVLSSSARIEKFAKTNLGLDKKRPEEVLQVRIKDDE